MSSAAQQSSAFRRVMSAPIGAAILARVTRRPDHRAILAQSGLPEPVRALIARVVHRTRLSYFERADIARELCAHFADALAPGGDRTPESAVASFGDPAAAAALIRRAKLRARPLLWRAFRRTRQAAAMLLAASLAAYGYMAAAYITAAPRITHDYLADLNASVPATPESERAWPLYLEAMLQWTVPPNARALRWGIAWPGDPDFDRLVEENAANQRTIATVRLAAHQPTMGLALSATADAAVDEHLDERHWSPTPEPVPAVEPALWATVTRLSRLEQMGGLLVRDACIALQRGDGPAVVTDLEDTVAVARHADQVPTTIGASAAQALYNITLDALDGVLLRKPSLLTDADLTRLAHALGGASPSNLRLESNRAIVADFLQRHYSDDGAGGGRLTVAALGELAPLESPADLIPDPRRLLEPLRASLTLPDRRAYGRTLARAMDRAAGEQSMPLYERPGRARGEYLFGVPISSHGLFIAYPSDPDSYFGVLSGLLLQRERVIMHRDATLTVIALELYKRRHGSYPQALTALVPDLLPTAPLDRYDGRPLRYALRDGRPLLYSVGNDRTDDGGHPPSARWGNNSASDYDSLAAFKERLALPGTSAQLRGDFVLFPPVRYDREGQLIAD